MVFELFKLFVMKELVGCGLVYNIKSVKCKIECMVLEIWDVLEEVICEYLVLFNWVFMFYRFGI